MKTAYLIAAAVCALLIASMVHEHTRAKGRWKERGYEFKPSQTSQALAGKSGDSVIMALGLDLAYSLPMGGLCHVVACINAVIRLFQKRWGSAINWLFTIPSVALVTLVASWIFLY